MEQVDTAQNKFAMPVVRFTYEQLQAMNEHKLSKVPCQLFLYCLGNIHAQTGKVHKFKVKEIAEYLGCKKTAIYQAIKTLRKAKLVALHLRFGTITGKVLGTLPSRQLDIHYGEDTDNEEPPCGEVSGKYVGHALSVGQVHNTGVAALIAAKTSGGWIRLAMACCLNIDLQTGELHEKRPQAWADLASIHRTWAVDGFTHLNEIGFSDVEIDYDVAGHIPCVAAATAYFNLREASKDKRSLEVDNETFARRLTTLYEAYGIQAKGWFKQMIENAWRLLGAEADKLIEKTRKKMVEEFGLGKDTAKEISRRHIINGKTLSIGEALPFS